MSEIEATLTRIKSHMGVKGHWVVSANNHIERNYYGPPNDTKDGKNEEGARIVATVLSITEKAQILVRDIDPSVLSTYLERTYIYEDQEQERRDHGRAAQRLQDHHAAEHQLLRQKG